MLALHCKYDESVSKEVSFENIRCVFGCKHDAGAYLIESTKGVTCCSCCEYVCKQLVPSFMQTHPTVREMGPKKIRFRLMAHQ